jgi:hypothetical protein
MWDGHVDAAEVPILPVTAMPWSWHARRMWVCPVECTQMLKYRVYPKLCNWQAWWKHHSRFSLPLIVGLLSDEQCKARMSRRKVRPRQSSKDNIKDEYDKPDCSSQTNIATNMEVTSIPQTIINDNPMALLCEKHQMLVARIVNLQDKYELPSDEDASEISVCISLLILYHWLTGSYVTLNSLNINSNEVCS